MKNKRGTKLKICKGLRIEIEKRIFSKCTKCKKHKKNEIYSETILFLKKKKKLSIKSKYILNKNSN